MTAFARHEFALAPPASTPDAARGAAASWELRSVNHRFFEVAFRLPDAFREMEGALRSAARGRFARGRIEATLRVVEGGGARAFAIDETALGALLGALNVVRRHAPELAPPSALDVLRYPGVLLDGDARGAQVRAAEPRIAEAFAAACAALADGRAREGEALEAALERRLAQIATSVAAARDMARHQTQDVIARIQARVAELGIDVEPARLAQEAAMLAQRGDIAEELDRLDAHVVEFRRAFARKEPVGRHLDFLAQELAREANTLASKAAAVDLSRLAIELKVAIEQIREQVQNVE